MRRTYAPLVAVVIEDHDGDGVSWGVGLGSPNPKPNAYAPCRDAEDARALAEEVERLRCVCGSDDLITPARTARFFTCEPCGRDFAGQLARRFIGAQIRSGGPTRKGDT